MSPAIFPPGLPAATSVNYGTRARSFAMTDDDPDMTSDPLWLPAGRKVTICYAAAYQDGWEGEVITLDPIRGGKRRLAVPRSALLLHE